MQLKATLNGTIEIPIVGYEITYRRNRPQDDPSKRLDFALYRQANIETFFQYVGTEVTSLSIIDLDDNDKVIWETSGGIWGHLVQASTSIHVPEDDVEIDQTHYENHLLFE